MSETIVWFMHTNAFRHLHSDAAALASLVRALHPGAPGVTAELASRLIRKQVSLDGEDGSRLTLTKESSKNVKGGLNYTIRVDFMPGDSEPEDFGLREFDRIMESLAHSAPVAAAIKAVRADEDRMAPRKSS